MLLDTALNSDIPALKQGAESAWDRLDRPTALAGEVLALCSKRSSVRGRAAEMLGEARHRPALDALKAVCEDPEENPWCIRHAAQALGRLRDVAAVPSLVRCLLRSGRFLDTVANVLLEFGRRQGLLGLLERLDHLLATPVERGDNGPDKLSSLRGQVLLALDRPGDAVAAFTVAIVAGWPRNENTEYLNWRGIALLARGAYVDAITDFDRSLDLAPSDELTRYWRALSYIGLRDWARASEDLRVSILYTTEHAAIGRTYELYWRAVICRGQQDSTGCVSHSHQARELALSVQNDHDRYRAEALIATLEGDSATARTLLTKAIHLEPSLTRFHNTRIYLGLLAHVFPATGELSGLLNWLQEELDQIS